MTIAAVDWTIFGRLERELGYLRAALRTLPVTLKHLPWRKVAVRIIEGHIG